MKGLLAALGRVSAWMNVIGGGILILMMLLTAADVHNETFPEAHHGHVRV